MVLFCFPSHLESPTMSQDFLLDNRSTLPLKEHLHSNPFAGTSLVVQCLRLHLPMQGLQVHSLARELSSHMTHSRKNKAKTEAVL